MKLLPKYFLNNPEKDKSTDFMLIVLILMLSVSIFTVLNVSKQTLFYKTTAEDNVKLEKIINSQEKIISQINDMDTKNVSSLELENVKSIQKITLKNEDDVIRITTLNNGEKFKVYEEQIKQIYIPSHIKVLNTIDFNKSTKNYSFLKNTCPNIKGIKDFFDEELKMKYKTKKGHYFTLCQGFENTLYLSSDNNK